MDDKAHLKRQREKEAISLAMESRWDEAVAANKEMLESFPNDTEALNRLGRALMELGMYQEAKEVYTRTLGENPDNTIARKNIEKLSHLIGGPTDKGQGLQHKVVPQIFIEETGKTGMVKLTRSAPKEILAKFSPGEEVNLSAKGASLVVMATTGEHLGEVVAGHAQRLIKLMNGGNKYEAAIASMGDGVKIIIKEVYQHPSQKGRLSFPVKGTEGLRPYVREGLLRYELEGEDEFLSEEGEFPAAEGEEKESELIREGVSIIEEDSLRTMEVIEKAEEEGKDES